MTNNTTATESKKPKKGYLRVKAGKEISVKDYPRTSTKANDDLSELAMRIGRMTGVYPKFFLESDKSQFSGEEIEVMNSYLESIKSQGKFDIQAKLPDYIRPIREKYGLNLQKFTDKEHMIALGLSKEEIEHIEEHVNANLIY